ncbi:hypothetical protein DRN98_09405 [Methanosarcinales archaeon]|nr:MAG: hypothetical protein DRN98_09405 [Methanosarcinales archaeon]
MVNYHYKICVPANTPDTSPYQEHIELRHDTILGILVVIPSGHVGATGIRIKYGPKQIMPVEPCTWITGDNVAVPSTGPLRLPESPIKLLVEAYNNSSNYDHCFYIYIDAIDWKDYPWGGRLDKMIELLNKLVMINEQAYSRMGVYRPRTTRKTIERRKSLVEPNTIIERIKQLLGRG